MNFKIVYILIACLLYSLKISAQLVNVESKRMQTDTIRFVLKSDILANYTENNNNYILQLNWNIATQVKSKDFNSIYFLISDYNLIRAQEKDFQNSLFLHSRFNQKIATSLWYELFIQYQNNTQLTIEQRSLLGTGLRYEFVKKDRTHMYIGNSYMYEVEKLNSIEEKFYNHRNSTYLSINQTLKRFDLSFTGTLYFQPLYRDFSNHRILGQFKSELPISKTISLSALYNYTFTNFSSDIPDDRSSVINFGISLNL
ncbi:DUF481 domain-containing protein [Aquimarina sp. ERC-38]|uniref:DUF481 domain-containing protein n=1 Tax=Aquimarina sp. ERC-38 TaxID=2949996 RepID=UPI002247B0DD|nr:DUF481 domain-containing protein [Aquimarina sp. ERC-38]UZO82338.1 DUF481 domain-containing protein [Aquimarina sp. ERC-38]